MVHCPSCGAATNAGATFCHACGATLAAAAAPAPAPAAPSYAPAPAAVARRERPLGVSIVGIVTVVFGAFSLLAGFFVLLFFGALGTAAAAFLPGEFGLLGGIFGVIGLFVAFFVFAFAVLTIVTGMGTLRGRRWAWTLMIVLMALNALRGLFGLADRDVGSLVTLAVSGVVIWYFFTPEVKQWFDRV